MSISSLTSPSPPSPTSSSAQMCERNSRRVRFSLPEAKLTLTTDKRTVHGTTKYVNGTLINITSTIHAANSAVDSAAKATPNGTHVKASCMKSNGKEFKLALRPASTATAGNTSKDTAACRRRGSKTLVIGRCEKSFNTLPVIENSLARDALERKSSSLEDDFDEDSEVRRDDKDVEQQQQQKLMAATNLTKYRSSDDLRDPKSFKIKNCSVLKLPEAMSTSMNGHGKGTKSVSSSNLRVPDYTESK
jgi:hypothetical protein